MRVKNAFKGYHEFKQQHRAETTVNNRRLGIVPRKVRRKYTRASGKPRGRPCKLNENGELSNFMKRKMTMLVVDCPVCCTSIRRGTPYGHMLKFHGDLVDCTEYMKSCKTLLGEQQREKWCRRCLWKQKGGCEKKNFMTSASMSGIMHEGVNMLLARIGCKDFFGYSLSRVHKVCRNCRKNLPCLLQENFQEKIVDEEVVQMPPDGEEMQETAVHAIID